VTVASFAFSFLNLFASQIIQRDYGAVDETNSAIYTEQFYSVRSRINPKLVLSPPAGKNSLPSVLTIASGVSQRKFTPETNVRANTPAGPTLANGCCVFNAGKKFRKKRGKKSWKIAITRARLSRRIATLFGIRVGYLYLLFKHVRMHFVYRITNAPVCSMNFVQVDTSKNKTATFWIFRRLLRCSSVHRFMLLQLEILRWITCAELHVERIKRNDETLKLRGIISFFHHSPCPFAKSFFFFFLLKSKSISISLEKIYSKGIKISTP